MQPNDSLEPQYTWKAQSEEKEVSQTKLKPEELAALVRSREKLNKLVRWAAITVMSSLAFGFLYNVWSADQPWIRFGQAWAFGLLAFVLGIELRKDVNTKGLNEPCLRFLERQHEERASRYLRFRHWLWLLIPSILASWIGGGPLLIAKARGADPASVVFRFCAGPWPFVLVLGGIVLVWLAFGAAAKKARRDVEDLRGAAT